MAITLRAAGSNAAGTTSINPSVGSGSVGDAIIRFVMNKPYSSTPTTPSGWTLIGTGTSGTMSNSTDNGSTRTTAWYKIATSSGTGDAASSSVSSGSPSMGGTYRFAKTESGDWDITGTVIADTSETGTTVDASGSMPAGTFKAGDVIAFAFGGPADYLVFNNPELTVSGCTLTDVFISARQTTTSGNDGMFYRGYATVASGTSTGSISFTATSSSSGRSATAVAIVRLREPQATTVLASRYLYDGNALIPLGERTVKQ